MDKIEGCEFNLNSEEPISFTNNNFELELVESKNRNNKIKAKCNTEKSSVIEIQCEIKDNADTNYSLKDEIIFDSSKFININIKDNKNKFKILCEKKIIKKQ